MRLATYNVENLFDRAKVMNYEDWADGKKTLSQFSELSALLGESIYTPARKKRMVTLLKALGLVKSDTGPNVILRRNRGELVKRPKTGGVQIVANGRADWVGSLELIDAPVDHEAMLMTARVIRDVKADVLAVVEAENRPSLQMFSDKIIKAVGGNPYDSVMLIDGNDTRGIDVGIIVNKGHEIDFMRSHVHDRQSNGVPIFSRDCPEYIITTAKGSELLIMVNHFKSKGYGSTRASNARRRAQAKRVRELYDERLAEGYNYIAVVGDLNDMPGSGPLKPLHTRTSMKDVFKHPDFDDGGFPGTFGYCNASNKIDFMLLSPDLFNAIQKGGVFRKGMWPGSRPKRWDTYAELQKKVHAGSDHACIWVDVNV